jgi:hypothetical protein
MGLARYTLSRFPKDYAHAQTFPPVDEEAEDEETGEEATDAAYVETPGLLLPS